MPCEEIIDNRYTQKKLTKATKTTRKCGGTTVKLKVWAGPQIAQYFHNKFCVVT